MQALKKAGCTKIFREKVSGASRDRPELKRMLDQISEGDVVVVWKLDRLARSTRHLLETMESIRESGGQIQSIRAVGGLDFSRRQDDHDGVRRHR